MHPNLSEAAQASAQRAPALDAHMPYISKRGLAQRWGCTERSIDRYRKDASFPKLIFLGPQLARFRMEEIEAYETAKRGKCAA